MRCWTLFFSKDRDGPNGRSATSTDADERGSSSGVPCGTHEHALCGGFAGGDASCCAETRAGWRRRRRVRRLAPLHRFAAYILLCSLVLGEVSSVQAAVAQADTERSPPPAAPAPVPGADGGEDTEQDNLNRVQLRDQMLERDARSMLENLEDIPGSATRGDGGAVDGDAGPSSTTTAAAGTEARDMFVPFEGATHAKYPSWQQKGSHSRKVERVEQSALGTSVNGVKASPHDDERDGNDREVAHHMDTQAARAAEKLDDIVLDELISAHRPGAPVGLAERRRDESWSDLNSALDRRRADEMASRVKADNGGAGAAASATRSPSRPLLDMLQRELGGAKEGVSASHQSETIAPEEKESESWAEDIKRRVEKSDRVRRRVESYYPTLRELIYQLYAARRSEQRQHARQAREAQKAAAEDAAAAAAAATDEESQEPLDATDVAHTTSSDEPAAAGALPNASSSAARPNATNSSPLISPGSTGDAAASMEWVDCLHMLPIYPIEEGVRHLQQQHDEDTMLALFYAPDLFPQYNYVQWIELVVKAAVAMEADRFVADAPPADGEEASPIIDDGDGDGDDDEEDLTYRNEWQRVPTSPLASASGDVGSIRRFPAARSRCPLLRDPAQLAYFSSSDLLTPEQRALLRRQHVRVALIDAFFPMRNATARNFTWTGVDSYLPRRELRDNPRFGEVLDHNDEDNADTDGSDRDTACEEADASTTEENACDEEDWEDGDGSDGSHGTNDSNDGAPLPGAVGEVAHAEGHDVRDDETNTDAAAATGRDTAALDNRTNATTTTAVPSTQQRFATRVAALHARSRAESNDASLPSKEWVRHEPAEMLDHMDRHYRRERAAILRVLSREGGLVWPMDKLDPDTMKRLKARSVEKRESAARRRAEPDAKRPSPPSAAVVRAASAARARCAPQTPPDAPHDEDPTSPSLSASTKEGHEVEPKDVDPEDDCARDAVEAADGGRTLAVQLPAAAAAVGEKTGGPPLGKIGVTVGAEATAAADSREAPWEANNGVDDPDQLFTDDEWERRRFLPLVERVRVLRLDIFKTFREQEESMVAPLMTMAPASTLQMLEGSYSRLVRVQGSVARKIFSWNQTTKYRLHANVVAERMESFSSAPLADIGEVVQSTVSAFSPPVTGPHPPTTDAAMARGVNDGRLCSADTLRAPGPRSAEHEERENAENAAATLAARMAQEDARVPQDDRPSPTPADVEQARHEAPRASKEGKTRSQSGARAPRDCDVSMQDCEITGGAGTKLLPVVHDDALEEQSAVETVTHAVISAALTSDEEPVATSTGEALAGVPPATSSAAAAGAPSPSAEAADVSQDPPFRATPPGEAADTDARGRATSVSSARPPTAEPVTASQRDTLPSPWRSDAGHTARRSFLLQQDPPCLLFPRLQGSRPFFFPQTLLRLSWHMQFSSAQSTKAPAAPTETEPPADSAEEQEREGRESDSDAEALPSSAAAAAVAASQPNASRTAANDSNPLTRAVAECAAESAAVAAAAPVNGLLRACKAPGLLARQRRGRHCHPHRSADGARQGAGVGSSGGDSRAARQTLADAAPLDLSSYPYVVRTVEDNPFTRVTVEVVNHFAVLEGPSHVKPVLDLLVQEAEAAAVPGEQENRQYHEQLYNWERELWESRRLRDARRRLEERNNSPERPAWPRWDGADEQESELESEEGLRRDAQVRSCAASITRKYAVPMSASQSSDEDSGPNTMPECTLLHSSKRPRTPLTDASHVAHAAGAVFIELQDEHFFEYDGNIRIDPARFAESTPLVLHFFLRTPQIVVERDIVAPLRMKAEALRRRLQFLIVADAVLYGNVTQLLGPLTLTRRGGTTLSLWYHGSDALLDAEVTSADAEVEQRTSSSSSSSSSGSSNGAGAATAPAGGFVNSRSPHADEEALQGQLRRAAGHVAPRPIHWRRALDPDALTAWNFLLHFSPRATDSLFGLLPWSSQTVVRDKYIGLSAALDDDNDDDSGNSEEEEEVGEEGTHHANSTGATHTGVRIPPEATLAKLKEQLVAWLTSARSLNGRPSNTSAPEAGGSGAIASANPLTFTQAERAIERALPLRTRARLLVMYLFQNETADAQYRRHPLNTQRVAVRRRLHRTRDLARQARLVLLRATEEDFVSAYVDGLMVESLRRHRILQELRFFLGAEQLKVLRDRAALGTAAVVGPATAAATSIADGVLPVGKEEDEEDEQLATASTRGLRDGTQMSPTVSRTTNSWSNVHSLRGGSAGAATAGQEPAAEPSALNPLTSMVSWRALYAADPQEYSAARESAWVNGKSSFTLEKQRLTDTGYRTAEEAALPTHPNAPPNSRVEQDGTAAAARAERDEDGLRRPLTPAPMETIPQAEQAAAAGDADRHGGIATDDGSSGSSCGAAEEEQRASQARATGVSGGEGGEEAAAGPPSPPPPPPSVPPASDASEAARHTQPAPGPRSGSAEADSGYTASADNTQQPNGANGGEEAEEGRAPVTAESPDGVADKTDTRAPLEQGPAGGEEASSAAADL